MELKQEKAKVEEETKEVTTAHDMAMTEKEVESKIDVQQKMAKVQEKQAKQTKKPKA